MRINRGEKEAVQLGQIHHAATKPIDIKEEKINITPIKQDSPSHHSWKSLPKY